MSSRIHNPCGKLLATAVISEPSLSFENEVTLHHLRSIIFHSKGREIGGAALGK
jgi:hypothetical protein